MVMMAVATLCVPAHTFADALNDSRDQGMLDSADRMVEVERMVPHGRSNISGLDQLDIVALRQSPDNLGKQTRKP